MRELKGVGTDEERGEMGRFPGFGIRAQKPDPDPPKFENWNWILNPDGRDN